MEGYDQAREDLRGERRNVVRLYTSEKLNERDYNEQIAEVEEKEDHYARELVRLNCDISDAGMTAVKRVFELAIKAKELWKTMNREERLEYLKKVCSNPTLDALTVHYHLEKPFA